MMALVPTDVHLDQEAAALAERLDLLLIRLDTQWLRPVKDRNCFPLRQRMRDRVVTDKKGH